MYLNTSLIPSLPAIEITVLKIRPMPILIFTASTETFLLVIISQAFPWDQLLFLLPKLVLHCSLFSSTVTAQMTFTSNLLNNFTRAPSYYAHEQP